ncbi:hypothetical protein HO757_05955 [Streptococcus suis]|uniref:Putative lipoprotein n=2 Tax=Streptococcus suis TaxID=1307 RepID=A0A0Z8QC83_STRSU|nr:DUF6287 domain-containing protein [Streptococcus suis]MCO8183604.1 DUF6287 domain-containing protein [Streptococcus suis]MCO8215352.1 DUF6287 domain-containing protein [Streptococcus suis]NQP74927.1 hypothetical protein [Streptococcus suis]NQP76940.1 hypothetical protein [Streptococcus suis]NQP91272.1 hypothetical protein [Streptococcus suis]
MKKMMLLAGVLLSLSCFSACQKETNSTITTSTSQETSSTTTISSETSTSSSSQDETTQTSSSQQAQPVLDILGIQAGDYSSLVGTWRDNLGNTLTFDKYGALAEYPTVKMGPNSNIRNNVLELSVQNSEQTGSFRIVFIPQNIAYSPTYEDGTSSPDTSDTSKDRILIGQNIINSNPDYVYYRVDTP